MSKSKSVEDIKKIMSVEEEMIDILPKLEDELNVINPWVEKLPAIFRTLKLKKKQIILDVPCGKGGVSIPLAKKYGVKVIGYDIISEYIKEAKQMTKEEKIDNLCKFGVEDIRKVVQKKNICDLLLWIATPHLWQNSRKTIEKLRNAVKDNGLILIGDAYLYSEPNKYYKNYESLDNTTKGYISKGDMLIKFIDFKSNLWKEDFKRTKKSSRDFLKKTCDKNEKKVLKRYLKSLNVDEKRDTKHLGLAIWIIKVNKK